MKTVKMLKDFPHYAAGQIVSVDEKSAKVLVDRKDAQYVDDAPVQEYNLAGEPLAPPVAAVPDPVAVVPDSGPADTDSAAAVPPALSRDSLKPELLAEAEARGIEGASAMTKNDLADALGLE